MKKFHYNKKYFKIQKKLRELNRDRVKLTKWDIFDAKIVNIAE